MHQRELARAAWRKAGLYSVRDRDMMAFLNRFEKETDHCWQDLAETVRKTCPQHKAALVMPLWETGDPLLRKNLLDTADLSQEDERKLVERLLGNVDPRRHGPVLLDAVRLEDPRILDIIDRYPDLPLAVRDIVSVNRARLSVDRARLRPSRT